MEEILVKGLTQNKQTTNPKRHRKNFQNQYLKWVFHQINYHNTNSKVITVIHNCMAFEKRKRSPFNHFKTLRLVIIRHKEKLAKNLKFNHLKDRITVPRVFYWIHRNMILTIWWIQIQKIIIACQVLRWNITLNLF